MNVKVCGFVTIIIILLVNITLLSADDRGFRSFFSLGTTLGSEDSSLQFKPTIDFDVTYLLFNQLEFGVGSGVQKLLFRESGSESFNVVTLDEDNNISVDEDGNTLYVPYSMNIKTLKRYTMPYYLTIKYNFDLNESGYIYTALKYGKYVSFYKLAQSKSYNDEENSFDLSYFYDISTPTFWSFSVGYSFSATIIAFEYRYVDYSYSIEYRDDTNNYTDKNYYDEHNMYFGLYIAKYINWF